MKVVWCRNFWFDVLGLVVLVVLFGKVLFSFFSRGLSGELGISLVVVVLGVLVGLVMVYFFMFWFLWV